jgi:transposase
MGKSPALVTGGHSILAMAWHLLSKPASYLELGREYFDRCDAQAYRLKLIGKLEALGPKVAVEPTISVSETSSSFS